MGRTSPRALGKWAQIGVALALVVAVLAVASANDRAAADHPPATHTIDSGFDVDITGDGTNDIGVRNVGGFPPTALIRVNGAGTNAFGSGVTVFNNADCDDATAAVYNFLAYPPNAFLPEPGDVYLVKDGTTYGKFKYESVVENVSITLTYESLGTCVTDPPPVSSFTWDSYDQIAFFTDTSTNAPNTWSWDFDGQGTSTQQNPSFFFNGTGPFTVDLTASNAGGPGTTFMDTVTLTQQPSTTRTVGNSFDLDGDGTGDVNVIAPDGCSGNATLQMTGGATYSGFSQDYRTVDGGDVPGTISGTGNFCSTEGVPGLFEGFFVQVAGGDVYKFWTPEIDASSVRMEFELVVSLEADLSITKTDDIDPIVAGNNLTYTIRVDNAGPDDAQNVVVTDTLPAGTTLVATSGCGEDPNGAPTCSLGTITAGGFAEFTIEVTVDSGTLGVISNTASVASSTSDPDTGNNSAMEDTTVTAEADLSITKSDSPDPVVAGTNLTYTVRVDNAGPSDATGVVVTDTLPAGVTLVSTTGCAEDPAGVPTCTLGTVPAGGFAEYTIEVTVDPSTLGVITNEASVTSDTTEIGPGDETTMEDTTVVAEADLVIAKSDSPDPVVAGTTLTYTVTVTNNGPSDAQDVVVTDTLPAGVTFVSTIGCAEDPAGVPTCSLGTIAAGSFKQFTIEVLVDPSTLGPITNEASVASSTPEASPGDETAMATTTVVGEADLVLTKTDDSDPAVAGEALTYTLRVDNNGPSDAHDVVVTDTLPAGVTFVSTNGCLEDPAGVPTCTLGTIPAGGFAEYTITVNVDPATLGLITNNASVTSSTTEANPGDEAAAEDTTVQAGTLRDVTDAADALEGVASTDRRLAAAQQQLANALDPALWNVDGTPVAATKSQVFLGMRRAVNYLTQLTGLSPGDQAIVDGVISDLVDAARDTASFAIAKAVSMGGNPGLIFRAERLRSLGDSLAARGRPGAAILRYENACAQAVAALP